MESKKELVEYQVGEYVEYTPTKEVGIVKHVNPKPFAEQPASFCEWIPVELKSGKHVDGNPRTLVKCSKNWYESNKFVRGLKHLLKYKLYK